MYLLLLVSLFLLLGFVGLPASRALYLMPIPILMTSSLPAIEEILANRGHSAQERPAVSRKRGTTVVLCVIAASLFLSLATEIEEAGRRTGDLSWRMPLFQPYKSMLRSTFADTNNCSDGGFGGAITAALFLEMFVKDVPWAHLDIYAWKDGSGGPYAESGGNGQPIQALASVLEKFADAAMNGRA